MSPRLPAPLVYLGPTREVRRCMFSEERQAAGLLSRRPHLVIPPAGAARPAVAVELLSKAHGLGAVVPRPHAVRDEAHLGIPGRHAMPVGEELRDLWHDVRPILDTDVRTGAAAAASGVRSPVVASGVGSGAAASAASGVQAAARTAAGRAAGAPSTEGGASPKGSACREGLGQVDGDGPSHPREHAHHARWEGWELEGAILGNGYPRRAQIHRHGGDGGRTLCYGCRAGHASNTPS